MYDISRLRVKILFQYFLKTFEGQYEIFSQNIYFPAKIRTGCIQDTKRSTNY